MNAGAIRFTCPRQGKSGHPSPQGRDAGKSIACSFVASEESRPAGAAHFIAENCQNQNSGLWCILAVRTPCRKPGTMLHSRRNDLHLPRSAIRNPSLQVMASSIVGGRGVLSFSRARGGRDTA
jgi:hypothetical protein